MTHTDDTQEQETGFFLSELYAPCSMLERAGYGYVVRVLRPCWHATAHGCMSTRCSLMRLYVHNRLIFTNPTGETPNMDPLSDHTVRLTAW
jgi:hypothetical protein